MLYYLTGMATERSAVLAYNLLHRGTLDLGEQAIAQSVIGQIKRQEPGHFVFYQLSARALWAELAAWQRWMVRFMRRASFAPVGANNAEPEGRLRRRDGDPRHHRRAGRLRGAGRARREGAALGAGPGAQGSRLRRPARSTRPSSWLATGPTCRTCTADRVLPVLPVLPGGVTRPRLARSLSWPEHGAPLD